MGKLTLVGDVTVDIDMVKELLRMMDDTTWGLTAEDERRWGGLQEILRDINDDYDDHQKVKVSNLPPDEHIVEIKCGCIVFITEEDYEAPDPEKGYAGAMFGKVIKRCEDFNDERGDLTPDTLVVYRERIVNEKASV